MEDVGITQDWFNIGQQLLAAGLTLLEACNSLSRHHMSLPS